MANPIVSRKLSFEEARHKFRYDLKTGKLYWKNPESPKLKAGDEAGCVRKPSKGALHYREVTVGGGKNRKCYLVHRIVWLLYYGKWPAKQIGHSDGDGLNNRIKNLSDIPDSINRKNMRLFKTNKSGHVGVRFNKHAGSWEAYIWDRYTKKHLGLFQTISLAVKARKNAEKKLEFHQNHGYDPAARVATQKTS